MAPLILRTSAPLGYHNTLTQCRSKPGEDGPASDYYVVSVWSPSAQTWKRTYFYRQHEGKNARNKAVQFFNKHAV